jgi:hypothetical protein
LAQLWLEITAGWIGARFSASAAACSAGHELVLDQVQRPRCAVALMWSGSKIIPFSIMRG